MLEWPIAGKVMPFMLAGVAATQVNKTRIVEAVVIAAISGGIIAMAGYYVAFPVLQEQVAQMRREGLETRQLIREIRDDINVRGVRRDAKEALIEAKIVQLQIEMARRK
jgi:hypothetical protein